MERGWERNVWAAGGSQDHGQGKQGCVLTNQCLGKETKGELGGIRPGL